MIRSVTITNDMGESVVMDLRSPEKSGFSIRGIQGLGPAKATINTRESLSLDGSLYNSARLQARNVVFDIAFLWNPTIEDVRHKSYQIFPVKKPVEILVETDNRISKANGYVESNEPDIFNETEAATISIICPDPYFYSLETFEVEFSTISKLFEFPFSNESLTQKLIQFGDVELETEKAIPYSGEASVGFNIDIHIVGSVTGLTIFDLNTREFIALDDDVIIALTGFGLKAGDEIIMSTKRGDKYVYLVRDGEVINILNAMTPDSSWLQLNRGNNVFYYAADTGLSNVQFKITYQFIYLGV